MAKYEKLYYPIGDAAKHFGEEVPVIRYWSQQFSILKPTKNKRGVRRFTADDMENLELIHYLLRTKKMTIEGARQELEVKGEKVQHKVDVLQKLQEIKDTLEKLKNKL